jgi:hypothetical protein
MTIRHSLKDRKDDCYETHPVAVRALLESVSLPKNIWEPACGPGSIVKVLRDHGHRVIASDLMTYGDPTHFYGRDFLMERKAPDGCEAIITNPPFKLAEEFVQKAIELCPQVIFLLRLAFLESERRTELLERSGLQKVLVFRNRLPMMHRKDWAGPKATSNTPFAWFCWNRAHKGAVTLERISWKGNGDERHTESKRIVNNVGQTSLFA